MHQITAIFAAAVALLTFGSLGDVRPSDATGGIGMAKPIPAAAKIIRRPMDAIPPFPAIH